jgi:uncharacterized protein YjbI with pentapeptide repeats
MTITSASPAFPSAIAFLESPPERRWQILKQLGLARYDFLIKMPKTEANIACVKRFLEGRKRVKFPDLSRADLSGLILDRTNLIRGNLSGANLTKTRLIEADLLFANFTRANLTDANLSGATLNETIWTEAIVFGCHFGAGIGLSETQRQDLVNRGAIFGGSEGNDLDTK